MSNQSKIFRNGDDKKSRQADHNNSMIKLGLRSKKPTKPKKEYSDKEKEAYFVKKSINYDIKARNILRKKIGAKPDPLLTVKIENETDAIKFLNNVSNNGLYK